MGSQSEKNRAERREAQSGNEEEDWKSGLTWGATVPQNCERICDEFEKTEE